MSTPQQGDQRRCPRCLLLSKGHPGHAPAGEVTLTGRVLPIGGVKEKTIAARRSGVKTLIFPKANQHDFEELSGQPLSSQH